ncbi:hypothetical protein E8E15_003413 [Penicillium rubens]|uniref:Pc22g17380 protein n=2 Tax=Penicillium chrysogenum species complex TaxID=254878 RepID=B6HSU3_PENRW|nr:uncharacterized protein N7525_004598 [Penicillium rubens]KZN90884.1 hypothetical protein EN45_010070 [Penicillium chrysogenum]CAP99026.1 Pc22g17380 [Penicillium rubens Wisconsin 54-1255]KAF3029212.1 hypothetical protein E8E15_003413 [Penicillium rubens]KAJ5044631.1 hypothetical protein NUH16_001437 [Penicillium rubens]KAJ5839410.1 hypothetical protein N7525_004598 [Penicillium rubens]
MFGSLKRALRKPHANVYGLDHAVLNIQLPPQSMWMNMGYWEYTDDFPEACQALLEQVLTAALSTEKASAVRILDVGCGCGDQSLYLTKVLNGHSSTSPSDSEGAGIGTTATTPVSISTSASDIHPSECGLRSRHSKTKLQSSSLIHLDSYIGITLESAQAALGSRRINHMKRDSNDPIQADIFCADAAVPSSWTGELKKSVTALAVASTKQNENEDTSTWLLALDTIYHFRPSRLPLLTYAHNTLNASFMAFDLILSDSISWYERILLRLVCWGTNSPFGNFVSEKEYVELLISAGYNPAFIEIRDISEHVFGGLADFIERRIEEARPFGIKMGKFRAARFVFGWWAKGRVVRGVVVVARKA